jgi:alkylation response protein AidB-like acyl-CoA dehydrogenase
VRRVDTKATRVDDGYVLDGRKEYSSNIRNAAYVIVVARDGGSEKRDGGGLSWFLVPTDAAGVRIGDRWSTLGLRAMDLSPLELRDVRVPLENRIGDEGRGFAMMGSSLSQSRTGIAAVGVGIARRARDEVLAFGSRRILYGEKLHKQQDFRFRIADMEKDIAAARALVWLSAMKHDQGLDATKEASIAKVFSGEMVMRVTGSASQMLGSIGYTGQSVVEKLYRDARHVAIVEGAEATHKEIIFATMLRRGGY